MSFPIYRSTIPSINIKLLSTFRPLTVSSNWHQIYFDDATASKHANKFNLCQKCVAIFWNHLWHNLRISFFGAVCTSTPGVISKKNYGVFHDYLPISSNSVVISANKQGVNPPPTPLRNITDAHILLESSRLNFGVSVNLSLFFS